MARAPRFTFTPTGFRDVFWCFSLNEPVIVTYPPPERTPQCTNCDCSCVDGDGTHEFLLHIEKPGAT